MFKIPFTFIDENESYITVPALKRFAKERKQDDLKTTVDRDTLIHSIQKYAEQSPENTEDVLNWVDGVLKEGIKDVQIKYMQLELLAIERLKNDSEISKVLIPLLIDPKNQHFCGNAFAKDLQLVKYELQINDCGKVISLYMGKLIHTYDRKAVIKVVVYPICVDVYVDRGIVVARGKSKSNMYKYMENGFVLEKATTTNAEKELKNAIKFVTDKLNISIKPRNEVYDIFRGQLYTILDNYTKTPSQIRQLMDAKKEEIEYLTSNVVEKICILDAKYLDDVRSDMENMIEKYFSISYTDKNIFTLDREAYPLKIIATDEEYSKVEQTAAFEEPLQSKAVFFDNKKMMQKSRLCDGVWFRYLRLDSTYCSKHFNVKALAKNDFCMLKFTEYTMEEDIVHVLFSIIDA